MNRGDTGKTWWPRIKQGLTLAFFALVAWLLISNAREIEWGEVLASMKKLPVSTLAIAALLAATSHAVYSTYDLLSRRYTGHRLPTPRVLATTFVSYVFNLNLGSLVGGVGFRHRLYSRQGLDNGVISRIIAFSMLTNWFGYLALAGLAFLLHPLELPQDWAIGSGSLRLVGAALIAVAAGYLAACAFASQRDWQIRGHQISLPSVRLAGLQLLVSGLNWSLIGAIVWILLQQKVDYPTVLSVILIAAIAGVITHVPAGLGVLEAVFVALLAGVVPKNELLGALLAYRALYYLIPLAIAALMYIGLEARIGRGTPEHPDTDTPDHPHPAAGPASSARPA